MAVNKYIIQLIVDTGDGTAKVRGVSKVFDDLDKQVNKTKTSIDKSKKSLDDMGGAAGTAGATAAEFGRLISDLPYGIQAVTNNISQLGSMFALLVSSSNGVGAAFRNLGKILMGPAGVLIAFQVVVAAIDFFAQSQRKAKRDIEDTTAAIDLQLEAIERIKGAFEVGDLLRSFGLAAGDGIGGAFDNAEARILGLVDFLAEKAPEFREAIEALTPEQREDVSLLGRLVKDYAGINDLRAKARGLEREILKAREKGKDTTELESALFEKEEAIFLRLQNLKPVPGENLDDFEEAIELSDTLINKLVGVKEKLEEPIVGFFDLNNLEQDVLEDVRNLLAPFEEARRQAFSDLLDEGGILGYYESELEILTSFLNNKAELEKLSFEEYKQLKLQEKNLSEFVTDAKIRNGELELQAIAQQREAELDILSTVFQTIGMFAGENRVLQAVALVGESAAGIAKIIINTKAANAALSLQAAIAPFLAPALQAQKVANNRSAAAGILSNLSATAKAVSALKAPVSLPSSTSVGGDTSTTAAPAAPAFNIVGASGQSQLAQLISGQTGQPIKAYVVAGEVTTAQSLERNKIAEASI